MLVIFFDYKLTILLPNLVTLNKRCLYVSTFLRRKFALCKRSLKLLSDKKYLIFTEKSLKIGLGYYATIKPIRLSNIKCLRSVIQQGFLSKAYLKEINFCKTLKIKNSHI